MWVGGYWGVWGVWGISWQRGAAAAPDIAAGPNTQTPSPGSQQVRQGGAAQVKQLPAGGEALRLLVLHARVALRQHAKKSTLEVVRGAVQ